MSSKKWLAAFAGTVLLVAVLVLAFNYATDPFGAFGDPLLQWWSYDETLQPRVAKLSYLEQHHDKYDSYVIGASSSSSFSPETLERYCPGSRFYNATMYGADMWESELLCRYLLEHYEVNRIVLSLFPGSAAHYGPHEDKLTYGLHYKVDGSSALPFYLRYLFINPQNGVQKLKHYFSDPYLQQSYRVFYQESGSYDKSRRDAEPIGSMEEYLSRDAYAVFNNYPQQTLSLPYLASCMESVAAIRDLCASHDVELLVVCPPMYHGYLDYYSGEDLQAFRDALAQVTDYWDFTLSSVSYDPRFFYDENHFRNCAGDMALARIFGDSSVYVPEGFGQWVTGGSAPALEEPAGETPSVQVPVLLYHNFVAEGEESLYSVSISRLEEHLAALRDAGYHTVSPEDLSRYVNQGEPLPDKPILITFDDGYLSNYTLAYPLLQKYQMKATIFVIGRSIGLDTYVDGLPMTPHFTLEQAREMEASGLVSIHSHGYNFHQVEGRDPDPVRANILKLSGESEDDYAEFLRQDLEVMTQLIGDGAHVIAYPSGAHDELAEVVLSQLGVDITLTTVPKINTLVQGLPQSLRQLGRISAEAIPTARELLAALEELYQS